MLEKDIVTAILRHLKTLPLCFVWKEHGGPHGAAGLPDVICCYRGRFVAFEVKRPASDGHAAGRLTKLQAITIARIKAAQGEAFMVTSLQDVKSILDQMRF